MTRPGDGGADREGLDRQARMLIPLLLAVALCAAAIWAIGAEDEDAPRNTTAESTEQAAPAGLA